MIFDVPTITPAARLEQKKQKFIEEYKSIESPRIVTDHFRQLFLERNPYFMRDNIQEITSAPNLAACHGDATIVLGKILGFIQSGMSSSSEGSDMFNDPNLMTPPSRQVLRYALTMARIRIALKDQAELVYDEVDCNECERCKTKSRKRNMDVFPLTDVGHGAAGFRAFELSAGHQDPMNVMAYHLLFESIETDLDILSRTQDVARDSSAAAMRESEIIKERRETEWKTMLNRWEAYIVDEVGWTILCERCHDIQVEEQDKLRAWEDEASEEGEEKPSKTMALLMYHLAQKKLGHYHSPTPSISKVRIEPVDPEEARKKLELEGESGEETTRTPVSSEEEEEKAEEVSATASTTLSSVTTSRTASGDEASKSETSSISGEMAEISSDEDREEHTDELDGPETIENVDILAGWRDFALLYLYREK